LVVGGDITGMLSALYEVNWYVLNPSIALSFQCNICVI
jgi:hypothetical protein